MELIYGKLIAAIVLSFVTFLASVLPVLLVKNSENEGSRPRNIRIVSFLSCFGGGVFMATCLLHLFPDVKTQIILISETVNLDPSFPVAEFLFSIGFLIVLILEQIVLDFNGDDHENIAFLNHQHSHAEPYYQNYGAIENNIDEISHDADDIAPTDSAVFPDVHLTKDQEHVHEISFHQDQSSHSVFRSVLLVFALGLHSIFEGLAIGLQTSVENVIKILLAVLLHKSVIAFTLGLNLVHSKLQKSSAYKLIVFFSLTSPIGIVIGLIVVDFITGLPMMITSAILQGLAAGTFLYVTFFEVLPHELNSSEDRMIKMACLILGYSVVSVLLLVFPS